MADQGAVRGDGGKTSRDHKGLIYTITGAILAVGVLMMAFYDRAGGPIAGSHAPRPIVTAQR